MKQANKQKDKQQKRSIIRQHMRLISCGTFPAKEFESLSPRDGDLIHLYLFLP